MEGLECLKGLEGLESFNSLEGLRVTKTFPQHKYFVDKHIGFGGFEGFGGFGEFEWFGGFRGFQELVTHSCNVNILYISI